MSKAIRTFLSALVVIVILCIIVLVLSLHLIRDSLPQTEGTLKLSGLRSEVNVYRDDFGIPHIVASNEADLFYTMGFVHAQDRLWQMDLSRRVALGTLSEIFGEKTIDADRLFRTIGLNRLAAQITGQLSPDSKMILSQYTAGINAYLGSRQDHLPIEFTVLHYKPQVWKMEDIIASQRLIAWGLSMGWQYDLVMSALVEKVGLQRVREIMPDYTDTDPFIIPSNPMKLNRLYSTLLNGTEFIPTNAVSNCWVVSGEKSTSGKPLLANDPHLKFTLPSIFYEIHLKAPEIDCYGVSMPGLPGIVIGHNRFIAWGLTNLMVDDLDFYIERIDSTRYFYKNQWRDIMTIEEIISIKDSLPETLLVRSTHQGPIISDVRPASTRTASPISLKWVGYDFSDETLANYRLIKATHWEQFLEGLRHFRVPGQNYVYADVNGNIGYCAASAIPVRRAGRGEFPYPSWDGGYDWIGYVPFDRTPRSFNPSQHYLITANNKVTSDYDSYFISNYWEPPYRAKRLSDLMMQKDKFSIEDFKKIQFDRYSKQAEHMMPFLLPCVPRMTADSLYQKFITDVLSQWNFEMQPDEIAPSMFSIFYNHLLENIFRDDLGDTLYQHFIGLTSLHMRAIDQVMLQSYSNWFDIAHTPEIESKDDLILKSLNEMYLDLIRNHGEIVDDWRWGKLHQIEFSHFLGTEKPFDLLFKSSSFPTGGDNGTVNMSAYSFQWPFMTSWGPVTRQIVNLSDIDGSLAVITTGQSGQPQDSHYKDQLPLWLNGQYHQAKMKIEPYFKQLILKPE